MMLFGKGLCTKGTAVLVKVSVPLESHLKHFILLKRARGLKKPKQPIPKQVLLLISQFCTSERYFVTVSQRSIIFNWLPLAPFGKWDQTMKMIPPKHIT